MCISEGEFKLSLHSRFSLLNLGPSDDTLGALHSVEVASATVGIGSHSSDAQPVRNFERGGYSDAAGNDVQAIASHSEEGRILHVVDWEVTFLIKAHVELAAVVLKAHPIHQVAVERMVKRFVEVVARLVVLGSLSQNSSQQIETVSAQMSARFSNDFVAQRIVSCWLKSLNGFLAELTRGEASSDVHKSHFMSISSSNLQAPAGKSNGFTKSRRSMLS